MAYKTYLKEEIGIEIFYTLEKAIIEIIKKNGGSSQPKIQKILEKPPYKNRIRNTKGDKVTTLSRMGLWKILNKLEKQGEIEKIFLDGNLGYQILHTSKINAEFCGLYFQAKAKRNFLDNIEIMNEFGSGNFKDVDVNTLMKFFGFYVLYSLITSRIVNKKQRKAWLSSALNLEKTLPISDFFEVIGRDEKKVMELTHQLRKKFSKNFAYMSKAFIDTTYDKIQGLQITRDSMKSFIKIFKDVENAL